MKVKVGFGQDSHAFEKTSSTKPLVLAGVVFEGERALAGNSDADVVLHAITNAISSLSGQNILGKISDEMCQNGITDSSEYLKEALKYFANHRIDHLAISIEALRPKITPKIPLMKKSLALLLSIKEENIGITATTGEGLTSFGCGQGIQAFAVLSSCLIDD